MRFRKLPGFPELYCDFVEGAPPARPFFPRRPDAGGLRARAVAAQERNVPRGELCSLLEDHASRFGCGPAARSNLARLRDPGTVVVTATLRPSLLTGPLCCWLKAATAAQLADWLDERGVPSVPVGWIDPAIRSAGLGIGILSPHGPERVVLDSLDGPGNRVPNSMESLIRQAARLLGDGVEDSDLMRSLRGAYQAGTEFPLAWGRSFAEMLEPLGMVLVDGSPGLVGRLIATVMPNLDPESVAAARAEQERRLTAGGYGESPEAPFAPGGSPGGNGDALETLSTPLIMQNLMFPVAADVIDESEAYAFAREQALFGELGIDAPLAWPRGSAVLVDARSRKVLAKYGVGIQDLFSGAETVTARLRSDAAFEETAARMEELEKEIAGRLQSLCGPGQEDRRMAGEIDKARRRILYQLDKLKKRASAARARRGEAVARQISGVCWRIAPWGKLQEREYAALQFLMQHPSLPGILRRGIDPFTFEHQLISIG